MAKPIEPTPVLKGDDAYEFVAEMEKHEKASAEEKARVAKGASFIQSLLTFAFWFPFFSLSNDRISLSESDKATWRRIRNSFPHRKHRSDYPAVKIARLGVNVNAQHRHIGTDILDFVKHTFITNNRTGCCFVTVDALPSAVPFYERNGFKLMRKENKGDTIPMYYDLLQLLW